MDNLPTGTLTFLFTDVEGSTRLLGDLGTQFQGVLERHQVLLRAVIDEHNGFEVSTEGDSFFCVFETASDGLTAAVDMQRAMAAETWPDGIVIKIRIGLHTGIAALGGDNYVGLDVHRASRISGIAHGGQVLASAATRFLGESDLPDGVRFRDLGEVQLKDIDRSEHVFQLDIAGFDPTFPPLRRLDAGPSNLPVFGTSLVGREQERQAVEKLFDESRLVTITGVAGAGKSRLAVEVASRSRGLYRDGIWLVDLAPIRTGALVAQAVSSAMGLQESTSSPAADVLVDYLRDGTRLLIFDNCEHVVDEVGALASRLIGTAPGLKVLTTSRQVLGIPGETRYPCPPLEVPTNDVTSRVGVLEFDSVVLFDLRAREVDSTFTVDNDNARTVAAICRRLDGMPLAIELAAALIRILTTQEILDRLHHRFELLTGGPRTAPSHQQTLRAALDSTFELLDNDQQDFASRLGVFVGGFNAAAAEAVASGGDIAPEMVLPVLSALVDRSLITSAHTGDGHRLTILESVREYLLGELQARGQLDKRQKAHALYFSELVEIASSGLRGPEQEVWAARIDADIENIRSAIAFKASIGDDSALRLVDRMFLYWRSQGEWSDGLHWTRRAVQSTENADSPLRARMIATAGFFASDIGLGGQAISEMEQGLAMAERVGDVHAVAYCKSFLGAELSRRDTDLDRALVLLGEAQQIYSDLNEPYGGAWVNRYLGLCHQERGSFDESIRLQTLSLGAFREAGDEWNMRFSQTLLAEAMHTVADLPRSRELYDDSLRGSSSSRFQVVVAHALKGLGKVSLAERKLDEAFDDLTEAVHRLREIGDVACAAEAKSHMAMVNLGKGHPSEAKLLLTDSLTTFHEIADLGGIAWTLERLAEVAAAEGSFDRAARLLGSAASIRRRSGSEQAPIYQPDVDHVTSHVRDSIGAEGYEALAGLGAGLDLDEAFTLGIDV